MKVDCTILTCWFNILGRCISFPAAINPRVILGDQVPHAMFFRSLFWCRNPFQGRRFNGSVDRMILQDLGAPCGRRRPNRCTLNYLGPVEKAKPGVTWCRTSAAAGAAWQPWPQPGHPSRQKGAQRREAGGQRCQGVGTCRTPPPPHPPQKKIIRIAKRTSNNT